MSESKPQIPDHNETSIGKTGAIVGLVLCVAIMIGGMFWFANADWPSGHKMTATEFVMFFIRELFFLGALLFLGIALLFGLIRDKWAPRRLRDRS